MVSKVAVSTLSGYGVLRSKLCKIWILYNLEILFSRKFNFLTGTLQKQPFADVLQNR